MVARPYYKINCTTSLFCLPSRPHRAGIPLLIPFAMGNFALLSLPMFPVLALLASIQSVLATATPFLLPVSQLEKVLLNLENDS